MTHILEPVPAAGDSTSRAGDRAPGRAPAVLLGSIPSALLSPRPVALPDRADDVRPSLPAAPPQTVRSRRASRARDALAAMAWAAVGLATVVAAWALAAARTKDLPTPTAVFTALRHLLADPLRNGGPNDQGIGRQLAASLGRVARGFVLAAVVGVPVGLAVGASRRAWRAANPVIQLLRPVSPLAWFPIWLITLKNAPRAAVVVIFITALWPILINTASAAAAIPTDQRNVARVFRFGRRAYLRHVLVPNALPGAVTGMRLSMGVAWMVIVAVEMLSGGSGIGFFVWDAYNALDLARVIAAIVLIGGVGYLLDLAFLRLARRVALPGVA